MRFTALLITTAISIASASLREACGDGKIINTSTISFEGGDITVTETECPGFTSGVPEERSEVGKRNVPQCNILCRSTGAQPLIGSCNKLTDALESHYPNKFTVNPNTMVTFTYSSCAYGYANLDTTPYDVCYLNFGYNGAITASQCFGNWPATTATAGGYCLSPETASNKWAIEVFNPI
ncbi:hypothetical protein HYDPIDRAFT_169209 [Hydnomerulius pinastri MD-312]|uniref:Uncharacterized protein n=1 Tax=Hydnomerulius pinastri MD-312 TaxID=994086 RepID=A0A0C9WDA0_9AGAM|nr:hypothetical protein HYDPIDRAFT_169209 [Hydnomerulius pinastri MD-312]